jgi:hypothetical protein
VRRFKGWRNLDEAVTSTVNALLEIGLRRDQGGAARDMILLVAHWHGKREYKKGAQWSI